MVYYDGQVLTNQIAYGIIGNEVVRWIKTTKLIPFINKQTFWLNRGVAMFVATISALGINYTYAYTPEGVLTLTFTGLTVAGVWHGFLQWVVAYGSQQLPYHLTRTSEDARS